jgi:outer membrane protein assembly factor BamD (BamD/ComL family)
MLNKLALLLLAAAVCLGGTACEHKKTQAELQVEKAKAFRDRQKIAAIKSYNDLITKYPDSEFAAKAKERLAALGPPPSTPVPGKKK